MARTAYTRVDSSGGGIQTTLNGAINASVDSLTLTASTGWPTITVGSWAVIDEGLSTEEKVWYTGRTSNAVSGVVRGVDGTSASSHANGATIRPCLTREWLDEANLAVVQTIGKITAADQYLYSTGAQALSAGTITAAGRALLDDAAASNQRTTLGLAIGADVQAYVGAWTTYVPVVTQSGTVTHTATYAKYAQFGKTVHATVFLAITGSGTGGNDISVTVPVTAATSGSRFIVGSGGGKNAAGTFGTGVSMALTSTTVVKFMDVPENPSYHSTALANGDVLSFTITYEAA